MNQFHLPRIAHQLQSEHHLHILETVSSEVLHTARLDLMDVFHEVFVLNPVITITKDDFSISVEVPETLLPAESLMLVMRLSFYSGIIINETHNFINQCQL